MRALKNRIKKREEKTELLKKIKGKIQRGEVTPLGIKQLKKMLNHSGYIRKHVSTAGNIHEEKRYLFLTFGGEIKEPAPSKSVTWDSGEKEEETNGEPCQFPKGISLVKYIVVYKYHDREDRRFWDIEVYTPKMKF